MITNPTLPPKVGYVEVETPNGRSYMNIKTCVLLEDEKSDVPGEIDFLKKQLSDTDYKVIKTFEYEQAGVASPYSAQDVHAERQTIRDRINELEAQNEA